MFPVNSICSISRCTGHRRMIIICQGMLRLGKGRSSHSARLLSSKGNSDVFELGEEACPQGIQGDDCSNFKLWQENCSRYGLLNCNDQLQGIQSGRKTLAEVLAEQEKLIADIAATYKADTTTSGSSHGGGQGFQEHYAAFAPINSPCPQGIQGDDCARYKLWLENCHRFGVQDCMDNYAAFRAGRKTLAEIFEEQDKLIREVVAKTQSRHFSTSTGTEHIKSEAASKIRASDPSPETKATETDGAEKVELNQRQKLKRAVKEYGSTVIVFHVAISLASLGFFYLLVSSGLDVAGFLLRLDIGGEILKSKLAAGTGTFVIAYAVHKVFAPVRIATTLTATPFIVRYLRQAGLLKPPSPK